MLRLETQGSWFEMGEQYGRALGHQIRQLMKRFVPDALEGRLPPSIGRFQESVRQEAPEIMEETAGMARAMGLPEALLLSYRFCQDVKALERASAPRVGQGCSVFFMAGGDQGPLLARTCDLERQSHPLQLCHVRRPDNGPASVNMTYVGMASAVGLTERGLGLSGASAHQAHDYGETGATMQLLLWRILNTCATTAEARELARQRPVLGKGCNMLVADADGDAQILELASGRRPEAPPPPSKDYQAFTNFYPSGAIEPAKQPPYLYNAYARYGRIVHQLEGRFKPHTVQGAKELLAEIAQPGPNIPQGACALETAYATVFHLEARVCHMCPGNPNDTPFQPVAL